MSDWEATDIERIRSEYRVKSKEIKKEKIATNLEHSEHIKKKVDFVNWFAFTNYNHKKLWYEPFWYSSLVLQLGFFSFSIVSFISTLQIENEISKGWILCIFYLFQIFFLILHTFIYLASYRVEKKWSEMSYHHLGRIKISLYVMWVVVIFCISSLFVFIANYAPPCCDGDVPGLTNPPYQTTVFVLWYNIMQYYFLFNITATAVNSISLYSQIFPERKIKKEELEMLKNKEKILYTTAYSTIKTKN